MATSARSRSRDSGKDVRPIAGLEAELSELEDKRVGHERRSEDLRSHRHQVLANAMRELESAEQQYRHIADQPMRLREHIEKLLHG